MSVVKITYYGDDEPLVEISGDPAGISIELIDGEELRWLFMEHNGVRIYYTKSDQDILSEFWFSTARGCEDEAVGSFDVRDLDRIPNNQKARYYELFSNDWKKQDMAYAIDQGKLTEEGLQ